MRKRWRLSIGFLLCLVLGLSACGSKVPGTWQLHTREIEVTVCALDDRGALWFGTWSQGVWVLEQGRFLHPVEAIDLDWSLPWQPTIVNLAFDSKRNLWCTTPFNRVFMFDGAFWREIELGGMLDTHYPGEMFIDSEDNKWFAFDQRLVKLQGDDWETVEWPPQVVTDKESVYALFVDLEEKALWIGTDKGSVWCGDLGGDWSRQQLISPQSVEEVGVLYQDPLGRLWVGTDVGLFLHEAGEWRYYGSPWDERTHIGAIMMDRRGQIWVGGPEGVGVLAIESDEWTTLSKESKEFAVVCISEVPDGSIWFAGLDGVAQFKPEGWQPEILSAFVPDE